MPLEVHQLTDVRAILTPSLGVVPKRVTANFYQELDEEFDDFKGHSLVSHHTFEEAWGVWEMHPHGDEMVILLSGDTEFVLRIGGKEERVRLSTPGAYVSVPRGVWHTAEPKTSTTMLFITPGEGTRNEEQPPQDG